MTVLEHVEWEMQIQRFETSAHIEYLHRRGKLCIANLAELENVGFKLLRLYQRNDHHLDPCEGQANI